MRGEVADVFMVLLRPLSDARCAGCLCWCVDGGGERQGGEASERQTSNRRGALKKVQAFLVKDCLLKQVPLPFFPTSPRVFLKIETRPRGANQADDGASASQRQRFLYEAV